MWCSGDRDVVDGLEVGSCFAFGEEVVVESIVAVVVGDSSLDPVGSVIGDDKDDDCDDFAVGVVLCVKIISNLHIHFLFILYSFYIHPYFHYYYNIYYLKRDWRYSP